MLSCKEKLNKKNKIGAAFTDDGFVMGEVYSDYFTLFKVISSWDVTKPLLTTALQSGGWVLKTSRSFHYWQPAPRWRPLPWLANPGNPRGRRKKQAPVTLIKRWKEKGRNRGGEQGRGDSLQGVPTLRRNANARKTLTKTPSKRYNALWRKSTTNPGACAYITNRWPRWSNLCS